MEEGGCAGEGVGWEVCCPAEVLWGRGGEVEEEVVGRGGRGMSTLPPPPPPLGLASVGRGGRGMSGRDGPNFPVRTEVHIYTHTLITACITAKLV